MPREAVARVTGNIQGQVGLGSEQPDFIEDDPAHCSEGWVRWPLKAPSNPNPSIILPFYEHAWIPLLLFWVGWCICYIACESCPFSCNLSHTWDLSTGECHSCMNYWNTSPTCISSMVKKKCKRRTGVIAKTPVQPAEVGISLLFHVALQVSCALLTTSCLPYSINGEICILRERELYTYFPFTRRGR